MTRNKPTTNRAEKIRARRNKYNRKSVKGTRKKNETLSRQMPPVMVRGGGYDPVRQSKRGRKPKTLKRRYDIALATPGVEIRLPSIPVVHFSWRILSFILVAGLSMLIYYMWTSPSFQVQMVEINGALRLSADEINRTLNIYNKPVFILNPIQMEESLSLAYPELKNVSIHVNLPANVVVHISERVPMIAWTQDSGTQWIDGDGYAFPPRGDVEKLVFVQAYASPPKPGQIQVNEISIGLAAGYQVFMEPELVAGILTMRSQAPAETELIYDPQHGLGWKDSRGWDVFFGMDGDDIESKLLVYKSIVKKLQEDGITPVLINVEHLHAPYYRLEQ